MKQLVLLVHPCMPRHVVREDMRQVQNSSWHLRKCRGSLLRLQIPYPSTVGTRLVEHQLSDSSRQ